MAPRMSKSTGALAVFLLGLLLLFASLAHAARPEPADAEATREQIEIVPPAEQSEVVLKGCGNECMMRRTLDAHLDYIYTQEKNN